MTAENPDDFVTSLRRRRDYVNAVIGQKGVTPQPLFLSNEEAQSLKAMLDPLIDPGIRGAVATGIMEGFGADAERVFRQLGIDDPVLKMGALEASRGGDPATMHLALQGQALIREKAVSIPTEATVRTLPAYTQTAQVLQNIPGGVDSMSDLTAYANAIYAGKAMGVDPASADGIALYEKAWQMALGETTDPRGVARGGLKPVFDQPMLLPPDLTAEEVELAISRATGVQDTGGLMGFPARAGLAVLGALGVEGATPQPRPSAWAAAADGNMPYYVGRPLDPALFASGRVQIIPFANANNPGRYYMTVDGNPTTDASGRMFMFDIHKLIGATK
jgi:hypothetical protein